jgi:hypothetical protein
MSENPSGLTKGYFALSTSSPNAIFPLNVKYVAALHASQNIGLGSQKGP